MGKAKALAAVVGGAVRGARELLTPAAGQSPAWPQSHRGAVSGSPG